MGKESKEMISVCLLVTGHMSLVTFFSCTVRTSLARRSGSVGGCSMKITEDVRKYAAERGTAEDEALAKGWLTNQRSLSAKARGFM